jgi:hypothetical protein
VHAPRNRTETVDILSYTASLAAEEIKKTDLDLRMAVKNGDKEVPATQINIVDQQSQTNTTVRSLDELIDEEPAGEITMDQVILHIKTALGLLGQDGPGHIGVKAIGQ